VTDEVDRRLQALEPCDDPLRQPGRSPRPGKIEQSEKACALEAMDEG
jgi:hypothetical protein